MFFCFIPWRLPCQNERLRGLNDVEISLKWLNWVICEERKISDQGGSCVSKTCKFFHQVLKLISTWTPVWRNLRNTLLVSVVVELSDTFFPSYCFLPLRPLILWALCLFPNIYTVFLKLKMHSQRFQLEKCGASECTPFNSRVEWSPECCRRVLAKEMLCL